MKLQTNIKIEGSQKELFLRAAAQAKEDLTEFLVNSAMLRIQRRLLKDKPLPAMEVLGQVYLQAFTPTKVSGQQAREVEELLALDRQGKLKFKALGKVPVRGPKRKR